MNQEEYNFLMYKHSTRSAFTLIELLVVIAIIAILAVVVVLTLNPAQLLAQARDSNRVSDMATLNSAINLYGVDQAGTGSFSLGTSSVTYVSIPDPTATTTAGTNCAGLGGNFPTSSTSFDCAASTTFRLVNSQGWVPINFSSISAGSPFGSLPVDPTNSTSSNLYYSYQLNGNQFRLVAVPESQKYLAQVGANPTMFMAGSNPSMNGGSWVIVPGNPIFGTGNFYVMKYDAVCTDGKGNASVGVNLDGNGYNNTSACTPSNGGAQIASLPKGNPIVDISQTTAASYCVSIGAHLITNNEWQTIAWNAENVASNWSGSSVGSGNMGRGNSDNSPATALTASSDDTQVNYGETANIDFTHRRTQTLSNGSVIWDMAGNIWQWTNDTITGANQPYGGAAGFAWREFTAITNWGTMTQQTAGPSNSAWNSSKGIGQNYSNGTAGNATPFGFIRGGLWSYGGFAGVETLGLNYTPGFTNNGVGFRCAR